MEIKKCPYCGKSILAIAKVCKHCGQSLAPQPQPQLQPQPQPQLQPQAQAHTGKFSPKLIIAALGVVAALVAVVVIVIINNKPETLSIEASRRLQEGSREAFRQLELAEKAKNDNAKDSYEERTPVKPNDNDVAAAKEEKIKTLINNYYTAFANREYYKLDNFFAETVVEFFAQKNVKGSTIKDGYKEYHDKILKTKSISYTIRWETFKQKQIGDGIVSVGFIMDYYLNSEKYGNQKYVLQLKIDINNDYKIVGMNEKTLERQQASSSPEISPLLL
jgi:hypothetical protein